MEVMGTTVNVLQFQTLVACQKGQIRLTQINDMVLGLNVNLKLVSLFQ